MKQRTMCVCVCVQFNFQGGGGGGQTNILRNRGGGRRLQLKSVKLAKAQGGKRGGGGGISP